LIAGVETSPNVIEWVLVELLKHPKIMEKLQYELDHVVGRERVIDEDDIPQLKYLQAIVKETFRLHPPLPLLLPHESM
jgi:cytochrome P450